jgi:hypothetical protein
MAAQVCVWRIGLLRVLECWRRRSNLSSFLDSLKTISYEFFASVSKGAAAEGGQRICWSGLRGWSQLLPRTAVPSMP